MWSWKSQGTPFRALIILEHSRTLINGLAAKVLALNLFRNFDGRKALFAPAVGKRRSRHPLWGVAFSLAAVVNGDFSKTKNAAGADKRLSKKDVEKADPWFSNVHTHGSNRTGSE
jgi:hypothetical protein